MKMIRIGGLSLLVILAACGDEAADIPRISPPELKAMLDANTAIAVDVRDVGSYAQQHIKGALSMPLNEIVNRLNELPRDKKIVTYCA